MPYINNFIMKTNRNSKYFASQKTRQPAPITKHIEVKNSNDNKIDQDFPGFPHGQAKENIINPKTANDKKVADVNNKDGEKRNYDKRIDEAASDGSGGAFDATEEVRD
jgi:hypothetical protein